jgi:hypothetical protein
MHYGHNCDLNRRDEGIRVPPAVKDGKNVPWHVDMVSQPTVFFRTVPLMALNRVELQQVERCRTVMLSQRALISANAHQNTVVHQTAAAF